MPQFYFTTLAADGTIRSDISCEADSLEDATAEGRRVLARLAADGLPADPVNMLSVEIYNNRKEPELELRLVMEEIRK